MSRTRAITFFTAIGFPSASEWDDQKLVSRLAQVTTRIAEKDVPDSAMPVYDELLEDPVVELLPDENHPAPPAARPSRAKQGKQETPRDSAGSPLGTVRAAVNAALAPEWKTDKRIAKDAGVGLQQARRWLRKIIADGKVEKRNQIIYRIIK